MMSDLIEREDAINEIEKLKSKLDTEWLQDICMRNGLIYAQRCVMSLPTVNRWIPCSDRLPEHYNEILFCERDRTIHKGYMYWDGTFVEHDVKFKKNDILAWMPMPDAYEPP